LYKSISLGSNLAIVIVLKRGGFLPLNIID